MNLFGQLQYIFTLLLSWNVAKGDEYQVLRKDAKQHWDSMKSCYQKVVEFGSLYMKSGAYTFC